MVLIDRKILFAILNDNIIINLLRLWFNLYIHCDNPIQTRISETEKIIEENPMFDQVGVLYATCAAPLNFYLWCTPLASTLYIFKWHYKFKFSWCWSPCGFQSTSESAASQIVNPYLKRPRRCGVTVTDIKLYYFYWRYVIIKKVLRIHFSFWGTKKTDFSIQNQEHRFRWPLPEPMCRSVTNCITEQSV